MSDTKTGFPKSDVVSPRDTQAKNVSALGGMPKTKEPKEIMKVNSPEGRTPAPDSFRPGTRSPK